MSTCGNRPLGTRPLALPHSLPGLLRAASCSISKAHRPDSAKRPWPRDSSWGRVVGSTGHISQAVLTPFKKKKLTVPLSCMYASYSEVIIKHQSVREWLG